MGHHTLGSYISTCLIALLATLAFTATPTLAASTTHPLLSTCSGAGTPAGTIAVPLLMPTEIIAQNGAQIHESTKITVTGCAKKPKPAKKASKHHKKGRKK